MKFDEMLKKEGIKTGDHVSVNSLHPKHYDYILSIDPDKDKSGFCLLSAVNGKDTKVMLSCTKSFFDLIELFRTLAMTGLVNNVTSRNTLILIEGGWLNQKSCFHEAQGRGTEKIAKDVGANHQTGRLLAEVAEAYGLHTEIKAPLVKGWQGANHKITHEELAEIIDLGKARTNPDERDAILLALDRAEVPLSPQRVLHQLRKKGGLANG